MRKAFRTLVVLTFAYLLQTTALPHLKIGGVLLDVITIALFAAGYHAGTYAAVVSGLLMGVWMEALTGELGGLTAVACLATSSIGAYTAHRFKGLSRAGKRGRDRLIGWLAPVVITGLVVMAREGVQLVYFYLTGVEIRPIHFFRVTLSGVLAGAFSVVLLPVFGRFMLRAREDTYLAKRVRKWRDRKKPAPFAPSVPVQEIMPVHETIPLDADEQALPEDPLEAYRRPEAEDGDTGEGDDFEE